MSRIYNRKKKKKIPKFSQNMYAENDKIFVGGKKKKNTAKLTTDKQIEQKDYQTLST